MKTIISIIICFAFATSVNAQSTERNSNKGKNLTNSSTKTDTKVACTCVRKNSDGKVFVEQNGKEINTDIKLGNTIVTPTGLAKKEAGAERILTEGNCISDNGTVLLEAK